MANLFPTSELPGSIIVAAANAKAGAERKAQLSTQVWPRFRVVHPLGKAVDEARKSGALIAFLHEGATLQPLALESAWWALDTDDKLAFVALGDERGRKTPMLDAVANCVVVRSTEIAPGAENNDCTRLGLASVLNALKNGQRGKLIREPFALRSAEMRDLGSALSRMLAQLRAQGLNDGGLGDTGYDPPPPELPLQKIDERPIPTHHAPRIALPGRHRVLALLQGFPMGGYAAFNADFLPRLVAAGHALTVCATEVWRTDWQLGQVRKATDDIVFAPGVVSFASIPRYVSHLIESRAIDVVFISHAFNACWMLPWLRRRHPRCAFVDYVHTDWFETLMYGSYATLSVQHIEWLEFQVASSQALQRELIERGSPPEKTRAVTINLDVAEWDPALVPRDEVRKALGCQPGQSLILYCGRTSSEKRPLFAVECWKGLIDAGIDARFAVAGAGPLLQPMIKAVNDAGLKSRVVFLGELGTAELKHVYAAADVHHAPSEIEGIARSLYESMALECVPVVADVGGQRELVNAECGFLIPHGSNEVARYVEALKEAVSPERQPRLAKAARARIVEHFNAGQCVAAFESIFDQAVELRRAQPEGAHESNAAARALALAGLEISRRQFWLVAKLTSR